MSSLHFTEGLHVEEASAPLKEVRIPELEIRENAKWLALLIDAEGSLGWRRYTERKDRINERYRFEYVYRIPYVSVAMNELESKETVDEGARLIGAYVWTSLRDNVPTRQWQAEYGRALSAMRYMNPHLIKFKRVASLCLTLFKYHTFIRIDVFDKVIEMLFGKYHNPSEVVPVLRKMTETEFRNFIRRAEELTNRYLK